MPSELHVWALRTLLLHQERTVESGSPGLDPSSATF